jgi:hypothetical protein
MDKHKYILFELLAYHYRSEGFPQLANDIKNNNHHRIVKWLIEDYIINYLR